MSDAQRDAVQALYVWQVFDLDGQWGTIAAELPGLPGVTPFVFRSARLAGQVADIARGHGRATGRSVRLVRFDEAAVLEERP